MMKKKKFKFQVNFEVCQLDSIPFVNCVLFAKVRLLDGGTFSELSSREEVVNNSVNWGARFKFHCKMSANATTGILDSCSCRVSIRKEIKGGKSFMKYGFVDLNLAEFAGAGCVTRRCLLEGYDSKIRQDNSTVKVKIEMSLLSGDSVFKAPTVQNMTLLQDDGDETLQRGLKGDTSSSSLTTSHVGSSGRLTTKQRPSVLNSGLVQITSAEPEVKCLPSEEEFQQSHSRSSSYNSHESQFGSQQSRGSGSTHSRSSSLTEHFSSATSLTEPMPEKEQAGSGSGGGARESGSWSGSWRGVGSNERRRKHPEESQQQKRVDDTRVDADEIVKDIISTQNFDNKEEEGVSEEIGLHLFIAKDGSTALGSKRLKDRMSEGVFEKVVIDQR
ncbi:early estrogen-induced gene 1 protein-like [Antedon mediterranea]|uniref:early estrogen-induced gene 1 protein-like n=1 Tax=Antedon mediterranea TaxID=105859 RepID=UPI003AF7CD13